MDEVELLSDNLDEVCMKGRKISSASALAFLWNKNVKMYFFYIFDKAEHWNSAQNIQIWLETDRT